MQACRYSAILGKVAFVFHASCQAEVSNLGRIVIDHQDVGWFQIAVYDATAVSIGHGLGQREHHPRSLFVAQRIACDTSR